MAETTLREWKDAPEAVRASVLAAVLFERDQKKTKPSPSWRSAWHEIRMISKSRGNCGLSGRYGRGGKGG